MKSSSGAHFIALDHVRALATFMVFVWHFTHSTTGYPVAFEYVPSVFLFSIFDEGQTGVALFMTLSGYLFAKLLDGKSIHYPAFIWNRALRLLPLLVLVILIAALKEWALGRDLYGYFVNSIAAGVLFPSLPNGGWSITVEFHYYLILPIFLWLLRKSKGLPFSIILAAISLRFFLFCVFGEIQSLAYWTLVGRIDQFTLGMLAFHFRGWVTRRHLLAVTCIIGFLLFYWYFDARGGFFSMPSYPSTSPLWIFLPTIEGAAYAIGIAWYESSFSPTHRGISKFIGRIGEYSYSIYLIHFFVVFHAARFVNERIMPIANFYLAFLWAGVFFLLFLPVGYLSFRFVEAPFLKLRKRYIAMPSPASPLELDPPSPLDRQARSSPVPK